MKGKNAERIRTPADQVLGHTAKSRMTVISTWWALMGRYPMKQYLK